MIRQLHQPEEKQAVARAILTALPEWFGMAESREEYIRACGTLPVWADFQDGDCRGFIAMKQTSDCAAEIHVMGVAKPFHRQGVGKALFGALYDAARRQGLLFLHVKTVRMGVYPEYDCTNRFYRSLGFRELECLPQLWDAWNPCQIYIRTIERRENET